MTSYEVLHLGNWILIPQISLIFFYIRNSFHSLCVCICLWFTVYLVTDCIHDSTCLIMPTAATHYAYTCAMWPWWKWYVYEHVQVEPAPVSAGPRYTGSRVGGSWLSVYIPVLGDKVVPHLIVLPQRSDTGLAQLLSVRSSSSPQRREGAPVIKNKNA